MIILTLYKEPQGKREKMEFALLKDAIEFGQYSGCCYDIYDTVSGKGTDWDEINFRDEDEWYYDDNEFLWKRFRPEDGFYNGISIRENHHGLFSQNPVVNAAVLQF